MTTEFEKLTEEEVKLYLAKNADYAKGGDSLGNFKRVAAILSNYPGLKLDNPTVIAVVYMLKQLDSALWMISQGYEGKVENIDTRLQDVHVYMKLARLLQREKNPPAQSSGFTSTSPYGSGMPAMADDEFRQSAMPKRFAEGPISLLKVIQQGGQCAD